MRKPRHFTTHTAQMTPNRPKYSQNTPSAVYNPRMSTTQAKLPKNLYTIQDSWRKTPVLAQAMPRIETNTRLTANISELMPTTLKKGWRAYLERNTLTLKVPHQALAMKIKQQAPLILDGLKMYGWDIKDMVVKVSQFNRPEWLNRAPNKKLVKNQRFISEKSAQQIEQTIANLPEDAPVRAVLIKLLAHQK